MPQMMIMFNVYRNRFIGAFWQSNGINVIPTISWANSDTYFICFSGVEKGSIVAISTLSAKTSTKLFMKGYKEMLRTIKPRKIICYGEYIDGMDKENTIFISYRDAIPYKKIPGIFDLEDIS